MGTLPLHKPSRQVESLSDETLSKSLLRSLPWLVGHLNSLDPTWLESTDSMMSTKDTLKRGEFKNHRLGFCGPCLGAPTIVDIMIWYCSIRNVIDLARHAFIGDPL